ncbi:MAG: hypothetical protein ACD_46C00308G0005 [uncultured bacterium]|nr:MAG: hypothetical protein ACD_46C00308G0005 [uncultured bacterium]
MSTRLLYFTGFIIVCILLLTSVYLQLFKGMMPCPLCTLQRISFGLMGFFFLLGAIFYFNKIARIILNSLIGIATSMGLFFATRQVWLQHFPPANSEECGVSLQYMMQVLPVNEVISKIIAGSAECTQRGFEFLTLNMAEWAIVWFVFFLGMAIYLFARECRSKA